MGFCSRRQKQCAHPAVSHRKDIQRQKARRYLFLRFFTRGGQAQVPTEAMPYGGIDTIEPSPGVDSRSSVDPTWSVITYSMV